MASIAIAALVKNSSYYAKLFELCNLANVRIVIPEIHDGPSKSSLTNIVSALALSGLTCADENLDVLSLARRGVLILPEDDAGHVHALVAALGLESGRVFLLFGRIIQQKYRNLIGASNALIGWGHPCEENQINSDPADSRHFRYCTAFTSANTWLKDNAREEIIWGDSLRGQSELGLTPCITIEKEDNPTAVARSSLYIFTDGAAARNGYSDCRASYAYYLTDGVSCVKGAARTPGIDIEGLVYRESNNRGELLGLYHAFACLDRVGAIWPHKIDSIEIFSDSNLAVTALNERYARWVADGELADKKNVPLIAKTHALLTILRARWPNCVLRHTLAHKKEPRDPKDSKEWLIWNGNYIVDKLANDVLRGPKDLKRPSRATRR